MQGCPIGIDIPGFIRLLREGDTVGALNRIREQNVLPGVCGRICLAPCETACIYNDQEASIGIRALERFAADNGRAKFSGGRHAMPALNGKKVAIIGSGPSGLVAAAALARKGFGVTIFEALPKAGGALRYGIPEFRLPSRVLDAEIREIESMGVGIRTNVIVGKTVTADELTSQFQAVLLATGSGSPKPVDLPGNHLIGVYFAQEFLMRMNMFNAASYPKSSTPALLGSGVAVFGSGPKAFDCARLALRLGKKVSVVFPGLEEEAALYPQDRKDAVNEGVKIESLTRPLEILATKENAVAGIRCERLDFTDDSNGHWDVKAVPGSEFILEADTVILAGPSKPSDAVKRLWPALQFNDDGTVWVEPNTGGTSVKNVFASGNVATGAGPIVDAIASGKRAAEHIEAYLCV